VDGVITIPNWGKHQNLDQLEAKKEYMRNYMSEYRSKQRALTGKANCKTNSKTNVSSAEEERDKEKEEEKKEEKKARCQRIADLFNSLCPSFPSVRSLSASRQRAILTRLETYTVADFEQMFRKAEASDFLKGRNARNWSATFDWLIREGNMAKVLEGNYDTRQPRSSKERYDTSYDIEAFERMCMEEPAPEDGILTKERREKS
jgi:hypothetical protein